MIFNLFWTILLGVIGGIISSVIVSKVFLIHSEYHQQVKFVEQIIRKLEAVSSYFTVTKMVFEFSYDQDIEMEHEMKAQGYRTEDEYYAAHKDRRWISKSALLETFLKEMKKTARDITDEIVNAHIEDPQLTLFLKDSLEYLHWASSIKEFTFDLINENKKRKQMLLDSFDSYKNMTTKQLLKLIVKDRLMIVLFVIIVLLTLGTIISYLTGI